MGCGSTEKKHSVYRFVHLLGMWGKMFQIRKALRGSKVSRFPVPACTLPISLLERAVGTGNCCGAQKLCDVLSHSIFAVACSKEILGIHNCAGTQVLEK